MALDVPHARLSLSFLMHSATILRIDVVTEARCADFQRRHGIRGRGNRGRARRHTIVLCSELLSTLTGFSSLLSRAQKDDM